MIFSFPQSFEYLLRQHSTWLEITDKFESWDDSSDEYNNPDAADEYQHFDIDYYSESD